MKPKKRTVKHTKKRKKRPLGLFSLIFRISLIVTAVALFFSYISIFINPSYFSVPLFFGLYYIPILFVNIILLILGMLCRSRATWVTFFIILPSFLFVDLFVNFRTARDHEEGDTLKLMTYNVGLFKHNREASKKETLNKILEFITKENPDIVCLQEFFTADQAAIANQFKNYPHISKHLFKIGEKGWFGNITLSKFPITNTGTITFKSSTNLCTYTDINYMEHNMRIYNTHLESHSISFTSLIKKLSNSESPTEDIIKVHDKMANTFKKRSVQVNTIADHSNKSAIPAIICGDFNDTPMSYTYRVLAKKRKDSFRESGKNMSATYSVLWPLLRIDYIMYPIEWSSSDHNTYRIKWSDHYPVIANIIIPR